MVSPRTLPDLDPEEQRVLGALMEKQVTVPASYPLTLAALRTACNQTSSRDPVVDYDEPTVEAIVKRLRERELVRVVWAATGRRTLKYHQLLGDRLGLADDERALLTVLLLRGPQPAGALRTQAERLHTFADREAVGGVPRGAGRPGGTAGARAAPPARAEGHPLGPRARGRGRGRRRRPGRRRGRGGGRPGERAGRRTRGA